MPNLHSLQHPLANNLSRHAYSITFYALLLLLVLAPIPFGGNREWAWSFGAMAISLLSLLWLLSIAWHPRHVSMSLPGILLVLFLIPLIWATLQSVSWMPENQAHPLWALSSAILNTQIPASISIAPDKSQTAAMRLLSYGLIFFLSFQFCRDRSNAAIMLKWLSIAAIVYALYGLISYWANFNLLLWGEAASRSRSLSSTFVNRNSYVTYAGLGLLCLMARSLADQVRPSGPAYTLPVGKQKTIENFVFNSWKPLLGLMLVTTALVSTQSRGGFISIVPAVGVFLLIYLSRSKPSRKIQYAGIGGVLLAILLAFSISNTPLLQRLTQSNSVGSERALVYKLTAEATADNALSGFGYGSYEEGFRLYRNDEVRYVYDKAHNVYLENSFELGVPAALSLFLAVLGAMLISIKGVIQRRRDWIYPATGVAATVLVTIHSLVDFSLQIPAIAYTYAAIMGVAVAQSFSGKRSH